MARWTDLAEWVGPTSNQGGRMLEHRGQVTHIMAGSYDGSISWGKNPDSSVSFHFAVRRDGHIAQLVDTDVTAWTQRAGNGHWISVENEGVLPQALTLAQVEANAKLFARGHLEYGWPLQIATDPDGRGLGHHSMGTAREGWDGPAWGHEFCPGEAIKAQKPLILARAIAIVNGEDDMALDGDELFSIGSAVFNRPISGNPRDPANKDVAYVAWRESRDGIRELLKRPAIQAAPVDVATVKAALLDPEVLAALAVELAKLMPAHTTVTMSAPGLTVVAE